MTNNEHRREIGNDLLEACAPAGVVALEVGENRCPRFGFPAAGARVEVPALEADRLSTAAAIYRYEGDTLTALKIEAVLNQLDFNRPVRVADLEAAEELAAAVLDIDQARP